MKKDIGIKPAIFPMPVLMIGTYGENDKVDVMNMAWGGISADNTVTLNIIKGHKTYKNISERNAFTVAIADRENLEAADYFGIVSGNDIEDKFERTGLTATKSEKIDAPIINEFPVTLECKVLEIQENETRFRIVGEIVGVLAEEKVLGEDGNIDVEKLDAIIFDVFNHGYYTIGEKVGNAWNSGKKFQ